MKNLIIALGLSITMLFVTAYSVNADEVVTVETTELPDAGTKPGNMFYGVDKFFENVALRFTFSDEKKAEKLSKIAEERLAELNELDEEQAAIYADELFNEFGLNLEKAHMYVQKLVAEGKISEDKLVKLEERVMKAEKNQEKVNEKAKDKVSAEVKEKVAEAIKNAKMSIFSKFEDAEAISLLHDQGYGYGLLLKLQAIANLSGKTIDELLLIEGVVTTNEENEKVVNVDLLLETLNITNEDLKTKLTEYRDTAKDTMKSKMDEANDKANERREEIEKQIENKNNGKN